MATNDSDKWSSSITRRSVLQATGTAAGAATLGVSGFSGAAAGQSSAFRLYVITPSTPVYQGEAKTVTDDEGNLIYPDKSAWRSAFKEWGIENQDLLVLDGQGNIVDAIPLNPQNVYGTTSEQVVQVATLAYNPADDLLYGIANQNSVANLTRKKDDETAGQSGRWVFTVDPANGNLTLVGDPNEDLRYIWGSSFDTTGDTYYGVNSDGSGQDESLFEITVGPPTTVNQVGGQSIEDAIGEDLQGDKQTNLGLSWNKLAPTYNLVSVFGNFVGETEDDLIRIDPDATPLLDANIAQEDVFASGTLVSTGFNPCAEGDTTNPLIYTIRNGNRFFIAAADFDNIGDVGETATLTGDDSTLVVVDNLAEGPALCEVTCTRTIGYWKNHPGCDDKQKGKSNKATIESVVTDCGGIQVGDDPVYENLAGTDDNIPTGVYEFGGDDLCSEDVPLLVDALDGANAKDMDSQLIAQLLAAKLNVCNGATVQNLGEGPSIITQTIEDVDAYFSAVVRERDTEDDTETLDDVTRDKKEMWKNILDGYNNQNVALSCEEDGE